MPTVKAFRIKEKAHKLKQYLFHWNFKVLELLLYTIIFFLKNKFLSFVNLSLFLHDVSTFWLQPDTSGTSDLYFAQA